MSVQQQSSDIRRVLIVAALAAITYVVWDYVDDVSQLQRQPVLPLAPPPPASIPTDSGWRKRIATFLVVVMPVALDGITRWLQKRNPVLFIALYWALAYAALSLI